MKQNDVKQDRAGRTHVVGEVLPGSIAEELSIEPGDRLLSINGEEVEDVFDYRFYMQEEELLLEIEKEEGEVWELEIEKEEGEDIGIEFTKGLMDDYRSCTNSCIFCFIDQMPPGMRDTLYFKDDDSRLSFLQGNYVTLTNMTDHHIDRIIHYRMEPINVSVQTTNPELRCKMLNNRFAGASLQKMTRLYEAGIQMNAQIVLCKGINDGKELDRSLADLSRYIPYLRSISVVPVGLTRYREGLFDLEPFTPEDAGRVLAQIHGWQEHFLKEQGMHVVQAGDEWYLLAGEPIPEEERYDGYLQLENGVGMMRLLENEVMETLDRWPFVQAGESIRRESQKSEKLTIATGQLAAPLIRELSHRICQRSPEKQVRVCPIENTFFGPRITVSGLITGRDLLGQLKEVELGDRLLIPCNMLRDGEDVFLDDVTVAELSQGLQVQVDIVKSSGQDLVEAITGRNGEHR